MPVLKEGEGRFAETDVIRYDFVTDASDKHVIVGFRSPDDMLFRKDLREWEEKLDLWLTVDGAPEDYTGKVGLVTKYIPDVPIREVASAVAIVVGPPPMMRFSIQGLLEREFREENIWVSQERKMCCGQCVKYCTRRSVGALTMVNERVVRDTDKCIGCGVCVNYCPTRAWTRSKEHYFRLTLLGRTGKKNPRLGVDFLKWADEESILKMIRNTYDYLDAYQDRKAVENKEHIGHIVDRTGFEEFLKFIMKDVQPGPKCEMNGRPYWGGKRYDQTNEMRSSKETLIK